jgi:pSer/pThr/pTyr-binding forkhead associated (FHA) protein
VTRTLWVTFQGRRYAVDKDRFVIGRGTSGTDLRIDDTNVSRKHVLIERSNGMFFMVDLGSTNGVYLGEDRITRKLIDEGDCYTICQHELVFSYG